MRSEVAGYMQNIATHSIKTEQYVKCLVDAGPLERHGQGNRYDLFWQLNGRERLSFGRPDFFTRPTLNALATLRIPAIADRLPLVTIRAKKAAIGCELR